jgi:hypothetical protein
MEGDLMPRKKGGGRYTVGWRKKTSRGKMSNQYATKTAAMTAARKKRKAGYPNVYVYDAYSGKFV